MRGRPGRIRSEGPLNPDHGCTVQIRKEHHFLVEFHAPRFGHLPHFCFAQVILRTNSRSTRLIIAVVFGSYKAKQLIVGLIQLKMKTKLLPIVQYSIIKYQSAVLEEDTQDCANFLLSLKNRNVTPEHSPEPTNKSHSQPHRIPVSINPYDSDDNYPPLMDEHSEMDLEPLLLGLGESLVCVSDRDLVPDALFVAMAQMKLVYLTESDKVGCYKDRPIGFVGLGCKHCGGQPGFGKYFPASVRSLAQTTTSQTILKHIGSKCRFCPTEVRQIVLDLQHQQAIKEAAIAGRPRYGSRKVFFQRVWGRLHNEPIPEYPSAKPQEQVVIPSGLSYITEDAAAAAAAALSVASTVDPCAPVPMFLVAALPDTDDSVVPPVEVADDASTASTATDASQEDLTLAAPKQKQRRFGGLPTKKNLMKRKQLADSESTSAPSTPPKRQRVEGAK